MKRYLTFILILAGALLTFSFFHPEPTSEANTQPSPQAAPQQHRARFAIDTIVSGMVVPWDIVFLPDNSTMLFTERPGRVRCVRKGQLIDRPFLTLTNIEVKGKMGLLGMRLHPQFTANHHIYLAYNYREGDRTFLRIVRFTYENDSLINPKTLIEHIPGVFNHTGCRMTFDKNNKLFITTGDADVPIQAQDLKALNGKILRLNDDGSIPADNPFVHNDTARHEIWTYGHRNPQGLVFQPGTGYLYSSEHGPTGGDEINLINAGNNYGWPVSHHRENKDGMMPPLLEFTPSIGPAEALFYSGKAFPDMKGNLLVGCMRGEAILRISFSNNRIAKYDFLFKKQFGRIRAVAEGPDGYIYFSTTQIDPPESNLTQGERGYDLILRMRPADISTPDEDSAHPQVTAVPDQEAFFSRTGSSASAGSATAQTSTPGSTSAANSATSRGTSTTARPNSATSRTSIASAKSQAGSNPGTGSNPIAATKGAASKTSGKSTSPSPRSSAQLYTELCAGCHGPDMNGKDNIPSLTDSKWLYGGTSQAIQNSIARGIVPKGMPAWEGVLSPKEIAQMAAYILKHKH